MNEEFENNSEQIEAHSARGGDKWFMSQGVGEWGQRVVCNYLVEDEKDIPPLAHGLGIALNISNHERATQVGSRLDYIGRKLS